jgi:cysteine desulfurase family protein (TIGR01976 family)
MVDYMYHHNANAHWAYATSAETDAARAHARLVFGVFLNCAPNEIVFGSNMTTLTFHVARALGRWWGPGDEVVVTELDHHANIAPWTVLEAERGISVKWARLTPETGQLDWDHLRSLVRDRTKLIAIGAAANAIGTVNDIRAAADMAHAVEALVFVDGVHYAPHSLVDVQAMDCDFFACSAYKCYGPHVGVLYGRHDLLSGLEFPKVIPAPDAVPERAETGTLNHEGVVGAAAAVEWLGSLGAGPSLRATLREVYGALHERSSTQLTQLWEGLDAIPGVALYGPPPGSARTPTLGFTVAGVSPRDVAGHLGSLGVFVSHGDFYARTVIERLGLRPHGMVRAGCACYTTHDEIARLVEGVAAITD